MGAVGGTLSYDALQQMAVAMHVRPELSYIFPVAIDGFIAYGVRALVVLKEAPLRARAYTWSVFGGATATSVWANWTHAVRLNETTAGQGFHLNNAAVGALSTIAPLVLGGATHLYIVMSRHTSSAAQSSEPVDAETEKNGTARAGQGDSAEPATVRSWWRSRFRRTRPDAQELDHPQVLAEQPRLRLISGPSGPVPVPGPSGPVPASGPSGPVPASGPSGPVPASGPSGPVPVPGPSGPVPVPGSSGPVPVPGPSGPVPVPGPSGPVPVPGPSGPAPTTGRARVKLEVLVPVARQAAARAGRTNREVVAAGLREEGYSISNERMGKLLRMIEDTDAKPPPTSPTGSARPAHSVAQQPHPTPNSLPRKRP
ncbi:DUF2637 domain-containing protein [Kitasatospora sp. NPDC056446]|uniref:DUF2637 domain-containing protein n=1 Tax=Kitasatospora sp. NPDC056446 TaxID=3345819 RepID=UPI00368B2856